MKSVFSRSWKRSTKTRKQRKYQANAPAHIQRSFLGAPLSKELVAKHKTRSASVRKGDTVKVQRGQFKGHSGKINRVDVTRTKIFIDGVELSKKDGSKVPFGTHPSNVMITTLIDDKKRGVSSQ